MRGTLAVRGTVRRAGPAQTDRDNIARHLEFPMTARRTGPLALAVLAAAAIGALTACGTSYPLAPTAASVPAAGPAGAAVSATAGASAGIDAARPGATGADGRRSGSSGSGSSGSGSSGSGGSGSGGSGSDGTRPGAGGAAAPAITSFRVVSQPTCPVHGSPDAPFSSPGTPVTIAWSVTGADGAAIAVDDPGRYGAYGASYPAKGQLELPFGCDATGITTHTFTVWPAGAEGTSRSVTVSARSDG